MKLWRTLLGNERGVALPLAMILLVVLTMLTLAFMSLGAVEPQISRNLSDGARARQLAESGIEWGFNQVAGKDFNDTTLLGSGTTTAGACGSGITCKVLTSSTALPGLTSTAGTFAVTMRNDLNTVSGDQALIGVGNTLDTSATLDNNKIVILTSTGTFNGASRTVTAVLQRGDLPVNAALSLPGAQGDTYSNTPPCGGCYAIDGRDWMLSDTSSPTGPATARLGIATAPGGNQLISSTGPDNTYTFEQVAEHGFQDYVGPTWTTNAAKAGYVQGKDQSSSATTTGLSTIAPDSSLSPSVIQTFLTNLASNPQTQILNSTMACQYPSGSSTKPEGLRMVSTGTASQVTVTNNCTTGPNVINQTVNLGTATAPTMLYVRGEFDTTSNFIGAAVSGSQPITGYGILVMEDADLSFFQSGQFQWNGIVLVTGRYVGTGFRAGSNTEIRGALISNETQANEVGGYYEFLNQAATLKVLYSKQGIDLALRALYNVRISAYREN
jgi:Tfp pilus assembly protein PilX